jgi:hypothetical protein
MKICPNCNQTYSDDSLNFCLSDGSILNEVKDNTPKTAFFEQPRVTNEINWQTNYQQPPTWQSQPGQQQNLQNRPFGTPIGIQNQNQDQTLPIISLILGILAVLTCCYGGFPLGAAAVVCGIIAIRNENNSPEKYRGKGLAIGGIITGAVGIAITIGFIILTAIS